MKHTAVGTSVAKKYAKAFLKVHGDQITNVDIEKMATAQSFLHTNKRSLFFLQLPQLSSATRLSMVEDLVGYFKLPQESIRLFLLLLSHNRSFLISEVLAFIVLLYKEQMGMMDFSIMSSHALSDQQKVPIKAFLDYSIHKKSICTYKIDKTLIAGIRIYSGEYMWEYSVRKQLACLRALQKIGTNR